MKAHPISDRYPLMPDKDFDDFVADIEKHGVIEPVVIYDDMILDGRHRWRACEILGRIAPTINFTGSEEEAAQFAESINERRRHLTIEERKAIIMHELKRDARQSDRSIAEKVKVHHETVGAVRATAEAGGEIRHHAERIGIDGVAQPAKKKVGASHAPPQTNKLPVQQRIEKIRAMAAAGHSTHQIADAQGVAVEYVNRLIAKNDITVCVPKRGRPIDGARIVRESVSTLSGIAHGLRLAVDIEITAEEAVAIRDELQEALREIRLLDRKLKEISSHG